MKRFLTPALLVLAAAPLAACGGNGDDALADRAKQQGEAQAEAAAMNGASEAEVDQIKENAEDRADAIDDSDVDAHELTDAQKNALVNGN
ncbi:hypothetical protein [Sphingomonas yantingensis]|jgi:predicted small lipoprotein YifL|uniref:Secreted protein n=2 Tax=Sphingomonas TaxID=13687 RepID=A0A3D0W876_9SPHN|nr:hypothetical protein [Sphingomonas yantingensis]MBB5697143.1 putative small lipoprotein YifL [Sphingomonas yantingensis]HCB74947.1 hypothetical protein [Sphingomonas bacterium]